MHDSYYFLSSYVNKNGLKKTIQFIDRFSNELIKNLKDFYQLDQVQVKKVINFNKNKEVRLINFDNRINDNVYQIVKNYHHYLSQLFLKLNKEDSFNGLLCHTDLIRRDVNYNEINACNEQYIFIRKKIPIIQTLEPHNLIDKIARECWTLINNAFLLIKEELQIETEYKFSDFKNYDLKQYQSKYHTLKIDDFVYQKLVNDHLLLLENTGFNTAEYLDENDLVYENLRSKSQLLYFYSDLNKIINFFSISFISDYDLSIVQLNEWKLDKTKFKDELLEIKDSPYQLFIKINLSKIIMVLLNKIHIGEVCVSPWDDDLYTEADKKGIFIL